MAVQFVNVYGLRLRFRGEPGMTGWWWYISLFFTLLSSTFPLIRGKRSELAMHKIVKVAVDCWLLAFRLSACFVGISCAGRCRILVENYFCSKMKPY